MASTLSMASIVCISLALICGIASLATTSWINGCVLVGDIIKALKHLTDPETYKSLEASLSQLKGSTLCYNSGIFRVSAEMPEYRVSKSTQFTPNPQDQFMHAVCGLLVSAVILFIVSIVFLGLSTCSKSVSFERQITARSYARIAVGILLAGSVLYGAGMITYTAEQSKVVHNYKAYILQTGTSYAALNGGGISGLTGLGGNSFGGGSLGRKRRQTNLDSPVTPMLGLQDDYNVNNHGFGSQSDLVEKANKALEAFNKMDPVFGYSFYIAWVGLVFAIFALSFGVMECRFNASKSHDRQPLPVL